MPRLSPIDAAFFLLETPARPMNVGALVVLDPPKSSRGGYADRLCRSMLKCPVGPPFSYRYRPGLMPGLTEAEDTDPRQQLHRHEFAKPAKLATLFEAVCDIHTRLLPRDRPLWETHVFEGLEDNRVALYFKTHHGLIDGLGFIRIVTDSVSRSPATRRPCAIWKGLPMRSADRRDEGSGLVGTDSLRHLLQDSYETAAGLLRLTLHQGLRDLGMGAGLALPFLRTPDVLKAPPTSHRVMGHCTLSLPEVRELGRERGAKVNDVMLTVLDMALGRYLEERGEQVEQPLVADVPVALHDHGGTGNRITILQVTMGRPHGSAVERFQDVLAATSEMKQEVRDIPDSALMLYSIGMHSLASGIESLGLGGLPMLANTVISNPAGLTERVYFNGAKVELALPVSVVAHHQVLNITVTTYVDELHVTFIALREAVPDVQRLADYTVDALIELEQGMRIHAATAASGRRRGSKRRQAARRTNVPRSRKKRSTAVR